MQNTRIECRIAAYIFDSVSTQEGLYIGADASKVEELYGKPSEVNGTN